MKSSDDPTPNTALLNLKSWLTLLLIMISITSALAKECPGYYLTNRLDTIKCKISIEENFFYKGEYLFQRISAKVKLVDAEGVKKFSPQEISGFVVYVPSGDTCKFVTVPSDDNYFYREMAAGKISMYLKYMTHPYDGGMMTDCVFIKNNEISKLGTMSTRGHQRKVVSDLVSDKPEVLAKWQAAQFSIETIQSTVKEYNKKQ